MIQGYTITKKDWLVLRMIDYAKMLLQKRRFEELKTNAIDVSFYVKVLQSEQEESVKLCMLINNVKGRRVTTEQITGMASQIERNLLLKGLRNIEVMCLIFTDNIENESELIHSEINFWLIDVKKRKLIIYDNQPDEYEAMKGALEYEMEYALHQKVKKRVIRRNRTYITWGLLVVNVLIFFILSGMGDVYSPAFMMKMGANNWKNVFVEREYYRLVTCMFLHFGFEHLASNMIMLAVIGTQVESVLGSIKFFTIYMVSGIGASIASALYYKSMGQMTVSAGASGAIFGIMGALAVMAIKDRDKAGAGVGRRIIIILILIVIDGMYATEIDYMAHLGGLLVGFIMTIFLYKEGNKYA